MGGYKNEGYEAEGDPKDQNYNVNKGHNEAGNAVSKDYANMSEAQLKKEKMKVMINVVLISFSFMLLFTAFQSIANLQSSINRVSLIKKYRVSFLGRTCLEYVRFFAEKKRKSDKETFLCGN